jgi:hypothetical protein
MLTFTPRFFLWFYLKGSMLSSRPLDDVFVSRVSQTREYNRGVKGSMLSLRLLDHVFMSRVSQTRDNIRGVTVSMLSLRMLHHVFVSRVRFDSHGKRTHDLTDAMRACYPLHLDYVPWVDSHGTRTHHLTDARRACYPLHHVYCPWFDSHGRKKCGVKVSMLSSRLLDHVFVSRMS